MNNVQFISYFLEHLNIEDISETIFDAVAEFVANNNHEDLAELVYQQTLDSDEIQKIACLFDILIWSTLDNGYAVLKTIEAWLLGNNQRKIALALFMSSVFPMQSFDRLKEQLTQIKVLYPSLAERCNYWINQPPNQ